jgi:hypothetical protein
MGVRIDYRQRSLNGCAIEICARLLKRGRRLLKVERRSDDGWDL